MSASARVEPHLAVRLRRALGNSAPGGALIETSAWRTERDALADLFEAVETTELAEGETRRVIELLSESMPADRSRMTASEWDDEVSSLVSELVSAGG